MKFHLFAISSSLLLGAGMSAIQPGNFLLGWLLFSFLFLLSFYVLRFTFFWTTRNSQFVIPNSQFVILLSLAFLLRLALGAALYIFLPTGGHPNVQNQGGYIFYDSFRRDAQAWELAQSDAPILSAFNKNFYSDQYGGLLAFSAAAYRFLSPDAHRPLLPVFFGALTSALGLAFLWKAVARQWDEKIALAAAWIYALFPESILMGSAQMREPFLMAFVAMALWGWADYQSAPRRAILWLALSFTGMLLVSPVVALLTLIILAGWMWVTREHGRVSWMALIVIGVVFLAGLYLLAWGLERDQPFGSSPLGIIMNWSRDAIKWDVHQLERGSGWIQKLFREMPEWLRPLFVMVYGITQPVLPATFIEPTTPLFRALYIFRSIGWYALVPLLFYAPFAIHRRETGSTRRLLLWLTAAAWTWIIVAALRGGADSWDNPRYRVILIAIQAVLAAYAWVGRDRWLVRWLIVEGIFVLVFTQWYVSRYFKIGGQLPFGVMIAVIVVLAALVMAFGWWWDRKSARRAL
ncbi:MAG: ArnT family glycosyltransferase [Chloroflexota bacterium]